MGITERKMRQKEEVKASILTAAWDLVSKEGWQALSIRKIADAIEYSVPVIYDHFQNKEAILSEFTKRGFQCLDDELLKARERYEAPEQQLQAMAYAYWDFAFNNKAYYQLMYGLGMPSCDAVKRMSELNTFAELILEPIRKLIATSNNPEADPYLKLHTFWSMLHGLISIAMMDKDNERDNLNTMVLKDFMIGFISGIKG